MASKKEEVANLLIAAAFDTSLKRLNGALASKGIEINSKTITTVIKFLPKRFLTKNLRHNLDFLILPCQKYFDCL